MSQESYMKWEDPSNPTKNMGCLSICSDLEGFRIIMLEDDTYTFIRVTFPSHYLVQWSDEICRLNTIRNAGSRPPCIIYEVVNSRLLKYFHEESTPLYDDLSSTKHYSIFTSNKIIDVISGEPPIVQTLPVMED